MLRPISDNTLQNAMKAAADIQKIKSLLEEGEFFNFVKDTRREGNVAIGISFSFFGEGEQGVQAEMSLRIPIAPMGQGEVSILAHVQDEENKVPLDNAQLKIIRTDLQEVLKEGFYVQMFRDAGSVGGLQYYDAKVVPGNKKKKTKAKA